MDAPQWVLLSSWCLIGLVFAVVGYLIAFRQYHNLIAGFDAGAVKNPQRISRWVGGSVLALGVTFLFGVLLALALPQFTSMVRVALFAVAIGSGPVIFIRARRLLK